MRPIAIDLFAGAGGMSLGFEQAGFDIAAAVEIDPIHCAVHKFNFPNTVIFPRSIVGLKASEIRRVAKIGNRPIDCVFGGPPCQGFSLIGHRALEDERNKLVLEFVRLVAELNARTFVFENVKGLTVGRQKAFLDELAVAFDQAGYNVRMPWNVLDAAWYGVPQHRERLILLGARKGTKLPTYPQPRTNPADDNNKFGDFPIGPNCRDALGDLPDAERFEQLLSSDMVRTAYFRKPSAYAAELRCFSSSDWHCGYKRKWDIEALTSSARTEHSSISRRRFAQTHYGAVEPISRFFKLAPNGLSNTLRAGTDGARGAFTSPRPIHYEFSRCITVREMARLHGFPDWFRFHVTKWHGGRQVGNAVPPPMARAVAQIILETLVIKGARSSSEVRLQHPELLSMKMSEASDYFGVMPPNNRRDRKSGAKKRKQWEIEHLLSASQAADG